MTRHTTAPPTRVDRAEGTVVNYDYENTSQTTMFWPVLSSEGSPDGYKPCLSVGSAQVGPFVVSVINRIGQGRENEAAGFHPFKAAPDKSEALCFGVSRFPQGSACRSIGVAATRAVLAICDAVCVRNHRPVKGAFTHGKP